MLQRGCRELEKGSQHALSTCAAIFQCQHTMLKGPVPEHKERPVGARKEKQLLACRTRLHEVAVGNMPKVLPRSLVRLGRPV